HASAPSIFWTCLLTIATYPIGRVLGALVTPATARAILVLLIVYFVDRFGSLFTGPTFAYRAYLIALLAVSVVGTTIVARQLSPERLTVGERGVSALRPLFIAIACLLGVALLA